MVRFTAHWFGNSGLGLILFPKYRRAHPCFRGKYSHKIFHAVVSHCLTDLPKLSVGAPQKQLCMVDTKVFQVGGKGGSYLFVKQGAEIFLAEACLGSHLIESQILLIVVVIDIIQGNLDLIRKVELVMGLEITLHVI